MMKKLFYCAALALALVACDDEQSRHQITVVYPSNNGYGVGYADQTLDSIVLYTFDSYKCTVTQGDDWFTLDDNWKQATIQNSYYNMFVASIPVYMETNTTDTSRVAYVNINNYGDDWNETVGLGYVQLGWLNVTRPTPQYVYLDYIPNQAVFAMSDSADVTVDSIAFTVEGNWTLESDASFVTPAASSGSAGEQVVRLSLSENNTSATRSATLTLTSNGVSTPITLVQGASTSDD